jgi:choice-of-anchor C domain-containing protein
MALLLGGAEEARANIIVNGSLESASVNPGAGFISLPGGSTAITGWTVGGQGVDYTGTFWQASDGVRSVDLAALAPGSISQTLATTPGTTYRIFFDLAGNPDGPPTIKDLQVSAAAATQSYTFDDTGATHAAMGWVTRSFDFTATASSTTLTFTDLDNTAFGPVIDNVRGDAVAAVPEPSSLALLTLGGLGLAGWRRWKGKRSQSIPSA